MSPTKYFGHTETEANADLDAILLGGAQLSTLPGAGRTTTRLRDYLANAPTFNPCDFTGAAIEGNVADAAPAFAAAQLAAGNSTVQIIKPGTYYCGSSFTFSSVVVLAPGVKIRRAASAVITFAKGIATNGPFYIPPDQFFDDSAGGSGHFDVPGTRAPEWWGAIGDGVTDDRAPVQAALECQVRLGGEVVLNKANYEIASANPDHPDYGLFLSNLGAKECHIRGMGIYASTIQCTASTAPFTQALFYYNCYGPGGSISKVLFANNDSGTATVMDGCVFTGNTLTMDTVKSAGFNHGLHITAQDATIRNIFFEFCNFNVWLDACFDILVSEVSQYRTGKAALYITGSAAAYPLLTGGAQYGPIQIVNVYTAEVTTSSHAPCWIDIADDVPVDVVITNFATTMSGVAGETAFSNYGVFVNACHEVFLNGCSINRAKFAGLYVNQGNVTMSGGTISRIGYADQSAPWDTAGVDAYDGSGVVTLADVTLRDIAGRGVRSAQGETRISDCKFLNCVNGGLGGSSAPNATTGLRVIEFKPQATTAKLSLVNNTFSASGTNTGKVAVYFDCSTAVPAKENVKMTMNTVQAGAFETPFGSTGITTAQLRAYDAWGNQGLLAGPIPVATGDMGGVTFIGATAGGGVRLIEVDADTAADVQVSAATYGKAVIANDVTGTIAEVLFGFVSATPIIVAQVGTEFVTSAPGTNETQVKMSASGGVLELRAGSGLGTSKYKVLLTTPADA